MFSLPVQVRIGIHQMNVYLEELDALGPTNG